MFERKNYFDQFSVSSPEIPFKLSKDLFYCALSSLDSTINFDKILKKTICLNANLNIIFVMLVQIKIKFKLLRVFRNKR
jgi:hypothetical protein